MLTKYFVILQTCQLQPYMRCSTKTRLLPKLKAVPICTEVPKEICNYDPHGSRRVIKKPQISIYCRDTQGDKVPSPGTTDEVVDSGLGVSDIGDLDGDGLTDDGK